MKKFPLFMIAMLLSAGTLVAQVGINSDGSDPDVSAGLDVKFENQGVLIPRMTTVFRNAIVSPAEGLLIFNLTTGCINYFQGGSWKSFCGVSEPTWQCGMKGTDLRDGKLYNMVKIGTQCWMAENLNIGTRIDVSLSQDPTNPTIEKYCYDDSEANCDEYGGLYQWDEAMQNSTTPGAQGICPVGWHLPTDAEWTVLTDFFGGEGVAGGKMKEPGYEHWNNPNTGATNESGFTALGSGISQSNGTCINIEQSTYYWSSTVRPTSWVWIRNLEYSNDDAYRHYFSKSYGFSVRCLLN